jgi:sirohydrochlorin ferrochelatase
MTTAILLDNGSTRPGSTFLLRRLAAALGGRLGLEVHPVSLKHSDRVQAQDLGGQPAATLHPFLSHALAQGCREFAAVPLFFGASQALAEPVPDSAGLARGFGPFALRLAPPLCPLPQGEPRLVEILAEQIGRAAPAEDPPPHRAVLVDHGSPSPAVNAVRRWLAEGLAERLGRDWRLLEAVMERRAGAAYDFNGELLESLLLRLAAEDPETPVILSLLFLAPGRHAGPGGDIAEICARVQSAKPGFRVYPTPLVGSHPGLIEILADRYAAALDSAPLALTGAPGVQAAAG